MVKNRLLQIRLNMGYRFAKDFALFLDLNPNQYSRYETNDVQPSGVTLFKICTKLGKSIEDIMYEEG